jgi:hypothetical protein
MKHNSVGSTAVSIANINRSIEWIVQHSSDYPIQSSHFLTLKCTEYTDDMSLPIWNTTENKSLLGVRRRKPQDES